MGLNKLNCEDILLLMSRHLDNDLSKEETWQIYHHANLCKSCQTQMESFSSVEVELAELNQSYLNYSLHDNFNTKIQSCISQNQHRFPWNRLWARLKGIQRFASFIESPFFPLTVGVVGSFFIFIVLLPQIFSKPQKTRFTVAEIPFQQAKDQLKWNRERTIPPGQSVVYSVNQGAEKSYHFRIISSDPVPVSFQHEDEEKEQIPVMLDGVRYATLKAPKANDRILIRNNGTFPIRINTHTRTPQSFNVSFKKLP